MKKLIYCALALATGLFAASCQQENLEPVQGGNTVTFTVEIPELATKAAVVDDGTNINDLVYAVYKTAATTEKAAKADTKLQLIYQKNFDRIEFRNGKTTIPIELINDQNYLIVFWAQVSDAWVKGDSFNLMRIGYPAEGMNANDSGLAAFTNVSFISKEDIKGGAIKNTVELTRPFAQIRIGTTLPKNVIEDVVLTKSSVTVTGAAEAFNVIKQEAIVGNEPTTVEFNLAVVPDGNITINNVDYKYAAMNYIFANGNVGVAYNIETANHGTVTTETIPDVPVQRNYRTNIVGNLLTSEAKYTVTLDQDWGPEGPVDNDYVVTVANNAEDIQEAIESIPEGGSGEITLGGDIDLNDLSALIGTLSTKAASAPSSLIIPSEKTVILNLNGYTLTQTVDYAGHSMIVNNGNLTLKGEGTVRYTYNGTPDSSYGKGNQAISNFGTLVLDGPTVENATEKMSHALFAIDTREGATFNVVDGAVLCANATAVRMGQFGADANEMTVEGGRIYGNRAVQVHLPSSSATVKPVMTLNVQGGVLESNDETDNIGVYVISNGQSAENVTVQIGGEAEIKGSVLVNAVATDTMNDAAIQITGGTIDGIYGVYSYSTDAAKADAVISVTGGAFAVEPNYVDEDYKYEEQNGKYVVIVDPVAKIGTTEYNTFEDAFRAANVGDTVTLLRDVRLSEELALPAGIIFNGNGKQINGTIYASGNLTFAGHTKVTAFSASYYNRTITIGESACLEVTGTGRVTLGYGNTFNITGNIDDAKTADKANIQPSLIIPGGISITGGNDAAMNVTNAYVKIGSTTSKNNAANGTFSLNFTNAIAEFTNQLTFAEPTSGMNPTFNVTVTNSVLTTGTKFIAAAPGSNVTIDNSEVTLATYFRNSGVWTLMNKSKLTGNTSQFGENGGNNGTTIVDGSEFVITGGSEGHALDGKGTGSIKLLNGAKANIDYLKDMILDIADGELTFTKQINCVIQIAEGLTKDYQKNIYYVSSAAGLEKMHEMFANQTAGYEAVLNLIDNIDFTGKTWTPVDSHADTKFTIKEINGNGHTISNLTINGQAMFRRFAGTGDVVVKDITFDNATVKSSAINTSILTVQSYQNVLLDNVDVKNSSITGGYKVAPLIATVYNEEPSTTVTATLKNCDVENVEVKAVTYDFCTTGMVAFVNAGDNDAITFENCTINNLKLIAPDDSYKAHAAIYTTGSGSLYNEADGVAVSNVTFETLK